MHELFLREDPFLLKLRDGDHSQKHRVREGAAFRVFQLDHVAEGKRLLAVHRVGIGAGNVDRLSDLIDPTHVLEESYLFIGNVVYLGIA